MATVGGLQEAALKRKEKLQALRNKHKEAGSTGEDEGETEESEKLPRPVFRSYQPQDETLKELQLPKAKPLEVMDKVRSILEEAGSESAQDEVDLAKLAPRKPDWDLKRDCAKKLEKLERRTQRAIAELIRERLQEGKDDLASAVSANTAPVADDDD